MREDELLVKAVVNKLYEKYGTYAHATGYLESTLSGLMSGFTTPEDVRRSLGRFLREMEKENGIL